MKRTKVKNYLLLSVPLFDLWRKIREEVGREFISFFDAGGGESEKLYGRL
jgi:hypothetical protein